MRTVVVSPTRNNPIAHTVTAALRTEPGFESAGIVLLDQAVATASAELVLVVLCPPHVDRTLEVVQQLPAGGHIAFVGPTTDPKLILRAMQAGAELFIDQDDVGADLPRAVARLRSRRVVADQPRQVIAVLSAAGGCGASTVAANVATLLAKARGRANLIDLNSGKADLAPLLDLKPSYSLADLCRNDGRLDRSMYEKLLARHTSGVSLLAAPRHYDDVGGVTPHGVACALAVAGETFNDIVIDVANCYQEEQLAAIEQATRILLVIRLDFTAVRNARRILDHLAARGVPAERVEVVVNHFDPATQLPAEEAEGALGRPIAGFIPHDADAAHAAGNVGSPTALSRPTCPLALSFVRLAGLTPPELPGPNLAARLAARVRTAAAAVGRALLALRARLQSYWSAEPHPALEPVNVCHDPVHAQELRSDARTLSA